MAGLKFDFTIFVIAVLIIELPADIVSKIFLTKVLIQLESSGFERFNIIIFQINQNYFYVLYLRNS